LCTIEQFWPISLATIPEIVEGGTNAMTTSATPSVQTLIMAGGRGERLYPLTASRPKPAVAFGGAFRIIDFTLSNCLNSGLTNVSLLTQYRHHVLQSYIQQSWSGLWSGFTREPLECVPPRGGCRYRGTADAVFQNIDELRLRGSDVVLILSADQVYHMDYRELLSHHALTNADVTIGTVQQSLTAAKRFGVVEVNSGHKVVGFQEKPLNPIPSPSCSSWALVNMGVYAFRREILLQALSENCRKEDEIDFGYHIIPSLIGSAYIRAYEFRDRQKDMPGYWRDIGTIDAYHEASMDLVRPGKRFDPFSNATWPSYPSPRFRNSADVRARLRSNCRVRHSILSPGVHIGDGGMVESSVLMAGVCVNQNAKIRNAIIEEGVCIPAGTQIGFDPDHDRRNHFVTESGVVVVSQKPAFARPAARDAPRQFQLTPRLSQSV
jgi:glucose-1-phosphate adenylyltransferase